MIIDQLSNASLYLGLGPRIATALRYLTSTDFSTVAPGRYEIDGVNVFALVQQYDTKPRAKGVWEAHRKYMDVQYVHSGVEWMGYVTLAHSQAGEYDEAKDFLPLHGAGEFFRGMRRRGKPSPPLHGAGEFFQMRAGTFMILAPQDAHMPGMALGAPQAVKKVVVKVLV